MAEGFQTSVGTQPAPAVEGDFASINPRFTVDAGPGGLISGSGHGSVGVTIGRFAWADYSTVDADGSPASVYNFGSGPPTGFVHREGQGLITTFLAHSGMIIPPGFQMTLHNGGDFWVKNNGATAALLGQKAYADVGTGAVSFAATGAPGSASVTGAIAAGTASGTGTIAGNVMTITGSVSGTIQIGATVTGTGVSTGTTIVSQLSGTPGGVGTYSVNPPEQTVASTTLTATYGTLTVSAVSSGTVTNGGLVGGSGVTAGTVITALGTGAGATGTYIVNKTQTVGSEALTIGQTVETKWVAMSSGLPGELVKISDHLLG